MSPARPLLRWFSGKWISAPWIVSFMPPHKVYTEAYSGAASVLMHKPPSADVEEIVNDIDDRIANLYQCLRSETLCLCLREALDRTPFSRTEFEEAFKPIFRYECSSDGELIVERARRLVVSSGMAYANGKSGSRRAGFRTYVGASRSTPVKDWSTIPDAVVPIHQRFKRVLVERNDALKIILRYDSVDALHYVDPPYVNSTRASAADAGYRHEMSDADHERLLDVVMSVRGMVLLCGYDNSLYGDRLKGWRREQRSFKTTTGSRIESLWLNPAADAALSSTRMPLFDSCGLLPAA